MTSVDLLVLSFGLCWLFGGGLGFRVAQKIDQHLCEYEGFDAPEAHLCSSSGNLEIAYKPPSKETLRKTKGSLRKT